MRSSTAARLFSANTQYEMWVVRETVIFILSAVRPRHGKWPHQSPRITSQSDHISQ